VTTCIAAAAAAAGEIIEDWPTAKPFHANALQLQQQLM
jgi:hypothetical protein